MQKKKKAQAVKGGRLSSLWAARECLGCRIVITLATVIYTSSQPNRQKAGRGYLISVCVCVWVDVAPSELLVAIFDQLCKPKMTTQNIWTFHSVCASLMFISSHLTQIQSSEAAPCTCLCGLFVCVWKSYEALTQRNCMKKRRKVYLVT